MYYVEYIFDQFFRLHTAAGSLISLQLLSFSTLIKKLESAKKLSGNHLGLVRQSLIIKKSSCNRHAVVIELSNDCNLLVIKKKITFVNTKMKYSGAQLSGRSDHRLIFILSFLTKQPIRLKRLSVLFCKIFSNK